MRAIEISEYGDADVLRLTDIEAPQAGDGEVLVRVRAAGINRPDVIQRRGFYPPPAGASPLPGLEVAGEIAVVGPGGSGRWREGDRVCALVAGGGYAEYVNVPEPQCLPIPAGLDFVAAASLPETFFTVWSNVVDRGGLRAGELLLVHGGSGGIGISAIQVGRYLGARVFTTAGSADKCRRCGELGAERAINYREEDFVEVVKSAGGADVTLDMVGGDYIQRNIKAAAVEGRIVSIAFLQGSTAEVDFGPVMLKRLLLTGSTLRARDPVFKGAIARALEEHIWPALADGSIRPVVDCVLPLAQAADAHRKMEAREHFGKIVLSVGD